MDEVKADIYARENFDLYKKAKLAVGITEEAFPTTLPEKLPVIGRAYKASEAAFTGFQFKNRADLFDKYIEIAKKSGVDITDMKELSSIGQMVNSLTGRGSLGAMEPVANAVNNLFFSPRFVKSQIDILTQPITGGEGSAFVKKQAAINLVKVVSGTAAVLVLADSIAPGSVQWDPRSTDFGQIRVGNTRFDVSGGARSIITLAARLATGSTVSGNHVVELNTGKFGAPTSLDQVVNFFTNKASPATGVLVSFLKGRNFEGEKPTIAGEALNLVKPLMVSNYEELKNNPNSANILVSLLADALGIGTNTYGKAGELKKDTGGISGYIKSLMQ